MSNTQSILNMELLDAAWFGELILVKDLIAKGADVNCVNVSNETPLHNAAYKGRLDVVKYLIEEMKVEVEPRNDRGRTPMYFAMHQGHMEVVKYLFFEHNALIVGRGLIGYPEILEHLGKNNKVQNIFAYVLQNKHRYTKEELQDVKTLFLKLNMNDEDTRNLKPIVKFF